MKAATPFLALALAACTTVPATSHGPIAAIGKQAHSNGVSFRPIAVLEDSRCPINALCVWAGRLTVRTELSGAGWQQTRDLELGVPQAVDQHRVALIAAEPSKLADAQLERRSYRFTFTASRR